VLQDMFAMIMLIDIKELSGDFSLLSDELKTLGEDMGLSIHAMHEDVFNTMHHI